MEFGAREKCPNMSTRSTPLAGIFTLPHLMRVPSRTFFDLPLVEHVSTSISPTCIQCLEHLFKITDENGKVSFFIFTSPSYLIPPAFTPSKPLPPSLVTAETSTLHLVWSRRITDTEFTLQMKQMTGEGWQGFLPLYNGSKAEFTVTGLQRNSKFHFRLRALNWAGSSEYSEEVSFSTMPDLPNAPRRPWTKGAIQTDSFVVAWTAPVDDGGSNDIAFCLDLNDGTGWTRKYCGKGQEFELKYLQPRLEYSVRVSAETPGGVGPFSETLNVTTAAVKAALVPRKPFSPDIKQDGTRVSVSWKSIDDNGNFISSYILEFAKLEGKANLVWEVGYKGTALSTEINNLDEDTQYLIRLSACNSVGRSEVSYNVSLKTTRQSKCDNAGKVVKKSNENTKKVRAIDGSTTTLKGVSTLKLAEKSITMKDKTVTREPKFKSLISTTSASTSIANREEKVSQKRRNSCPTFQTTFFEPSMVISGTSDKKVDVKVVAKADMVTAKKRMDKEKNNKGITELNGPQRASHNSKSLIELFRCLIGKISWPFLLLLCLPLIRAAAENNFAMKKNEVAQYIFHVEENGDFNITRPKGCHYWVHQGMEEAGNDGRMCCYDSVYANTKHCIPHMQEPNCRIVSENLNGSEREIMLGHVWSPVQLKIHKFGPGDAGKYMCYNNKDIQNSTPKYTMELKMKSTPKEARFASVAPIIVYCIYCITAIIIRLFVG